MSQSPILPDEPNRLATLLGLKLLDTPPEERFDRITRTAARLLDVPIALVSLIDDKRQWIKASYGLSFTEIPRDGSFCAHTIAADNTLVIPDTLNDPRFADSPLVTSDPLIRFYPAQALPIP